MLVKVELMGSTNCPLTLSPVGSFRWGVVPGESTRVSFHTFHYLHYSHHYALIMVLLLSSTRPPSKAKGFVCTCVGGFVGVGGGGAAWWPSVSWSEWWKQQSILLLS